MTVEEKRRELFEAFYLGKYYEGDKQCGIEWLYREPCGGYRFDHPARHWETFNAAIDAVVIDLPGAISAHNTDINGFVNPSAEEYDECLDDCRAAIESIGLGLKVIP